MVNLILQILRVILVDHTHAAGINDTDAGKTGGGHGYFCVVELSQIIIVPGSAGTVCRILGFLAGRIRQEDNNSLGGTFLQRGEDLIAGAGKSTVFIAAVIPIVQFGIMGNPISNLTQRAVVGPVVDTEFNGNQICRRKICSLCSLQNMGRCSAAGDTQLRGIQTGAGSKRRYICTLFFGRQRGA